MRKLLPYSLFPTLRRARKIEADIAADEERSSKARRDLADAVKHLDKSRESYGRMLAARVAR